MFGLEVHHLPFTINLPLTLSVGQYPNHFRVVGLHMEPIKGLRGNWVKVVISVYRMCIEVYQHPTHPNFFQCRGDKIGLKFSHHTCGSWCRGLAQCPSSLARNCLVKEVVKGGETPSLS